MTQSYIGKHIRLNRILKNNKTIIVPVDDSLIMGPKENLFKLNETVEKIVSAKPNALMGFKNPIEYMVKNNNHIPYIYNITASTMLRNHTRKSIISSVENAITMGADCVAAHINFSSTYETEMLKSFSQIANDCDKFGIPLLAIAYPRRELDGKDYNYNDLKDSNPTEYAELVAHCVRIACELGADIIKTQYTGSVDSFRIVTESACNHPIITAGGSKKSVDLSLKQISEAIEAGAAGISFGRNVFNATNIDEYISAAKSIVFDNYTYQNAIEKYYKGVDSFNEKTTE